MRVRMPKPAIGEEYIVDNGVYTDRATFDAERERIFLGSWNFVCHESEIPSPGDYLTTTVAGQAIIVCRNREGKLRAFFNTCRHRAAEVVRDRKGNARDFVCFYHQWCYDLDGKLIGIPGKEAYKTSYNAAGLDGLATGLVPVPIDSLHRLVFVRFDDEGPTLKEFLAEAADILEHPFADPGLKIWVERDQTVAANWKMQAENSRDGYHAPLLHKRLMHVSPPRPFKNLTNGHTVQYLALDYDSGIKHDTVDDEIGSNPELAKAFLSHPLPGMTREHPSYVVTLFPDTLILVRYSTMLIERQEPLDPGTTMIQFRAGQLASDSAEVAEIRRRHWYYYWDDKKGNLPEDIEAYESQQRAMRNGGVPYSLIARGEPGHTGLRGDDNRLRWFWENWRKHMKADRNAPLGGSRA